MSKNIRPLFLALSFLLGVAASTFYFKFSSTHAAATDEGADEHHLGQSEFVNPLIDCVPSPRGFTAKENELRNEVNVLIQKAKASAEVSEVSVYYRDLVNGPSIHINSQIPFIGASLLKVPILVAYFRKAESDPGLLDRTIVYDPKTDRKHRVQNLETAEELVPGKSYTVRELIRRMIVESDNVSASLLVYSQPDIDIVASLNDMGIPLIKKQGESWVTVLAYASLFRILYNSTYLDTRLSNEALKLLTQAEFNAGLVAGVDSGLPVAHKFGERELDGIQQFHDCGIIYYPKRPYLLCVMTRGRNAATQVSLVANISRVVFKKIKEDIN